MNSELSTTIIMDDFCKAMMSTPAQQSVDRLAAQMMKHPQIECPLHHEFAAGFYIRTIQVPAKTLVVSKIFKQSFPFFVSKGTVSVWVEGTGTVKVTAPYWGMTKPGTRRVIYHHDDVELSTIHFTDKTDPDEIEKDVIFNP